MKKGSSDEGLMYELKVHKAITDSSLDFLDPGDKPKGHSRFGSGDIQATLNGDVFNIEVKKDDKAQMGSGSLSYDMTSKKFKFSTEMDPEYEKLILSEAKKKTKDIDKYIRAARKLDPVKYNKNIKGMPIKISKSAPEILKKEGLLKNVSTKVKADTSFIEKHYNAKDVFYIQIGEAGLFYLKKNPLNLPIPRLKGHVDLELRLIYSGKEWKWPDGTVYTSATYRFHGRLKIEKNSPHSIDTVAGIKKLFTKDWKGK